MDSSAASPFPADTTLSLAIHVDDSMLGQQHETAASSRVRHVAPLSSASYKVQKKAYKCKFCARTFKSPQALGGHQKAHRDLREALDNPPHLDWSTARPNHPLARSTPPPFPRQTGTSRGLAPVDLSSSTPVVDGYRGTGDGGQPGGLREVNQEETADGIDLTLKL